jgi:trans-aconitate methyltransferase
MSSTFVAKGADGYDQYMGRWSKRLAPLFLDFAGVADGERIIDVGCGTGSLTFLIPDRANVATIEAIDFEPQFVEALI